MGNNEEYTDDVADLPCYNAEADEALRNGDHVKRLARTIRKRVKKKLNVPKPNKNRSTPISISHFAIKPPKRANSRPNSRCKSARTAWHCTAPNEACISPSRALANSPALK